MKRYLSVLLGVLFSTLFFASCSDDDDDSGSGDFIEVTIDGKTYRHNVYGFYTQWTIDSELVATICSEDVFYDDGFEFLYGIYHYEDLNKLLKCSTGQYGIGIGDDGDNLDFTADLEYNSGNDWWQAESGTHTVTSIKKVSGGAQIEGSFKVSMYSDDSGYKEVSGKYRMTVDGYDTSL